MVIPYKCQQYNRSFPHSDHGRSAQRSFTSSLPSQQLFYTNIWMTNKNYFVHYNFSRTLHRIPRWFCKFSMFTEILEYSRLVAILWFDCTEICQSSGKPMTITLSWKEWATTVCYLLYSTKLPTHIQGFFFHACFSEASNDDRNHGNIWPSKQV